MRDENEIKIRLEKAKKYAKILKKEIEGGNAGMFPHSALNEGFILALEWMLGNNKEKILEGSQKRAVRIPLIGPEDAPNYVG